MKELIKGTLILIFLLQLMTLKGCSSQVYEKPESDVYYKMDIEIEYNKAKYSGVAVLPYSPAYELRFKSPGKMDLFTFRTCSREISIEESRFQGSDKKAVVHYMPTELEQGSCPIDLGSFEKEKGRHAWGIIDFQGRMQNDFMPANIICGGDKYISDGVTICQQREQLIQSIEFDTEVITAPTKECSLDIDKGKKFIFNIKKGYCVYVFMEIKGPHRIHRLTTYGYEKILLREG